MPVFDLPHWPNQFAVTELMAGVDGMHQLSLGSSVRSISLQDINAWISHQGYVKQLAGGLHGQNDQQRKVTAVVVAQ